MKNISIVLSETELKEMLAIVKAEKRTGACIVVNGPIEPNGIDSILHYSKATVHRGNGSVIKEAGQYFKA